MERDEAIRVLTSVLLDKLPAEQRRSILEEWWPHAREMPNLPDALREEMQRAEGPADVNDTRYDPLLLDALELRWSPATNAFLSEELGGIEVEGEEPDLFACVCCGYRTLDRRGEYDICAVCFWEDDGVKEPSMRSGPNHMTLAEGRENFARLGACDAGSVKHVDPLGRRKYRRLESADA